MSLSKPVSPLLDGYNVGEALTAHHGVYSCPALRGADEERYIVKVISIPASQDQLDALLLTGAFENELRALEYFEELTNGVCDEIRILERLSKLDGFVPFLGYQREKKEDCIGYDIYALLPYRPSLEEDLHSQPLTHLAAVNLGLDMCAALSVCRKAGYLYADLKPNNIFKTEMQGYCIGDLGFIPLNSLQYASLPEKYRSAYTAPEVKDAYASLNESLDIYALGLVLYQVYNNGELPVFGDVPPSPMYADYEMAEIILKACAPNPADRWENPAQMGQALVDYMQRNGVNDTSIVPPPPEPLPPAEPEDEEFLTEEENDAELSELLAMIPEEEPPEEVPAADPPDKEVEEAAECNEDAPGAEQVEENTEVESTTAYPKTEVTEDGVTEEVADMLAQADELLQGELPYPVIVPEPIDIPIPPPIVPESEEAEEAEEEDDSAGTEDADTPDAEEAEAEEEDDLPDTTMPTAAAKKRKHRFIVVGILALVISLLALGAHFFYQGWYLQSIESLTLRGEKDSVTITVVTKVDEAKLTAVCTDTYGNTLRQPIQGGKAHFSDLKPNTQYKIQLQIEGFHELKGNTSVSYTTATQTQIVSFHATMGTESGSVHLNFVSDGPDSEHWLLEYAPRGGEAQTQPFTDKSLTLYDLTVGTEYTFRILSEDDLFLTGSYELTYTPQALILPLDVQVQSYADGIMTVQWATNISTPIQWSVRCRNDSGFDQTLSVSHSNSATFTDLDMTVGYAVTVTAEGMPRGESIHVNPNPINVTGYQVDEQVAWSILLTWDYTGQFPSGWIVVWEVDGVKQADLECATNRAIITVRPNASYRFEVRPADEVTYFTKEFTYEIADVPTFEGYGITAEDITVTTHRTPDKANWRARDLSDETQSSEFTLGESACLLLESSDSKQVTDMVTTTFVIFDSEGKHISTTDDTRTWDDMWSRRQCAVALPEMPTQSGDYSLDLYIAGQYVTTVEFTINEASE